LKILITVGIYPPDIGGPASFVPKIANLLTLNNIDVTVICLTNQKINDNEKYKVKRIYRKQNLIFRWIKTVLSIIRNGYDADIIFVNGLPMESYVANIFLRKKLIRKIVGDWAWERGRNKGIIEESFDELQINSHNFHLEIAKFSRGWTATKANLVITPSEHLSNVVNNWGVKKENLKVIYNGTKISNASNEVKTNEKILKIITVGRLAPWKNIDSIITSMSILKNKNINFELVIVGSGPLEESLKNLVKDFGLEKQIIFTGQKTATELADYYKKSEIYIQASGYEGLPHVLLEAINYNLTLVSTPIGGSNEVLENGKNGWILQLVDGLKPDPNNLSSIIMDIKNSNESRKRKKSNAKNLLIEKFDEEQNLIKYLEVFQS
jgi:glycosyltransferase involved in cell wall biosynthesis